MEKKKNAYRIDVISGDCSTFSEDKVEKELYKIPEDVILKLDKRFLGVLSYGVLVSDSMTCALKLIAYRGRKPLWCDRLKAIAVSNKNLSDDGICVDVIVKDEGDNIGVYYNVEPNIECACIYQGSSEKFFYGEGLPANWEWLSSCVFEKVKLYGCLNIACIHLMFIADVQKGFDQRGMRYFKGLTTEKGLFGEVNNDFCPEGEYTLAEIVCM